MTKQTKDDTPTSGAVDPSTGTGDTIAPLDLNICLIDSLQPKTLAKKRWLEDGNLKSEPTAQMTQGTAENVTVKSLQALADIMSNAPTNRALIAASHTATSSTVKLLSTAEYNKADKPADSITRTRANFVQPAKSNGLMILDCDEKDYTKQAFIDAVNHIVDLSDTATIYRPSSSSYLFNGDAQLTGDKGKRLYIIVKDASDIERAGHVLFDRLWLSGHGRYLVGVAGQLLDRSIIDLAMFGQTNRLDFIADSDCKAPLRQQRPPPEINEGVPLDSKIALPDLTAKEQKQLDKIKAEAKANQAENVAAAKDDYATKKAPEHLAAQGIKKPTSEQLSSAKDNVLRALDADILTGEFIVTLATGERLSIAAILKDKERYDGVLTLDPIEPEYNNNAVTGKLYLINQAPRLFSQAHGGKSYRLFKQASYIEYTSGRSRDATDDILSVMRLQRDYFDMGDQLVKIQGGKVMPLGEDLLRYELGDIVQLFIKKIDKQGNEKTILIEPTRDIVKSILALKKQRGLKQLNAVITAPTITTKNGLPYIVAKRGYDAYTGLFLASKGEIQPFNDIVSADELQTAYASVMAVFDTFKLASPLDRSVALSAFLTAIVRPTLSTAPAFAFDAPTQGSGKTYLAECLGIVATGDNPPLTPSIQGNEAETQKIILAMMVQGSRVIVWDNVMGLFNSATIASMLTSNSYSGRVLGVTEHVALPNKAMFMFTGNNIRFVGDMPRRVLTARLDTGEENATNAKRDLSALNGVKPSDYIKQNRQALIRAGITIIQAYLNSSDHIKYGKLSDSLTASFEQWDILSRQPIVYLRSTGVDDTLQDPKQSIDDNMGNDPDKLILAELLTLLYDWQASKPFTSKMLYDYAFNGWNDDPKSALVTCQNGTDVQLRDVLNELCRNDKNKTSRAIGKQLAYRKERIADGLQMCVIPQKNNKGNLFSIKTI